MITNHPYEQGKKAFIDGLSFVDNPYDYQVNDWDHIDWSRGYYDQQTRLEG